MSHLSKLKVSRRVIFTRRQRNGKESVEHRRKKLIANLEEQVELARLAARDEPLELKRKRGHNIVTVRPRVWWKKTPDGRVYTQILYNRIPLTIDGRGTAIEAGSIKDLPKVYQTVVQATKAGELDRAIASAVLK